MRHTQIAIVLVFLLISILSAAPGACETLLITSNQLYALASFQGEDKEALLSGLKDANPDSTLKDVSRVGAGLRLHFASGEYIEILTNELYSLASYIPQGVERTISDRSSPNIGISSIKREGSGVVFRLDTASSGRTTAKRPRRRVPPPASGDNEKTAEEGSGEAVIKSTGPEEPLPVAVKEPEPVKAPETKPAAVKKSPEEKPAPEKKPARKKAAPKPTPKKKAPPKKITKRSTRKKPPAKGATKKKSAPEKPSAGVVNVGKVSGLLPVVDGAAGDKAWKGAPTTSFPLAGFKGEVTVSALEGSGQIFFLFNWPDQNPTIDHRRWYWDDDGKLYRRSKELDDGLAVRWLMNGKVTADLRSGDPGTYDAWIWRPGREGLGHYASDARIVISDSPVQLARYFTNEEGKGVWFKQEYDRGRLPFEVVIPPSYAGDRVNSFTPQAPMDSASDVQARGQWKDGVWTLEMSRKLVTENQDDQAFEQGKTLPFVVSLFERKELDAAPYSEVLILNWK